MISKTEKKGIRNSIWIIGIIIVVLIPFRIILHYSEMGVFEFLLFDLIPKWFLFILPTVFLVYRILKRNSISHSIIDFGITGAGFYIIYFILTPHKLDDVDWYINYERRLKIVALAKADKLEHVRGSLYAIPDSLSLFPFFKSNEIVVQRERGTTVTVIFYTDRGLNDHYSGFVYTDDDMEIGNMDDKVKGGEGDFNLEPNWYLVHD